MTPAVTRELAVRIIEGDALSVLRTLPAESVQCVVTSPPYFALRAYNTEPKAWGGDPDHEHDWGGYRLPSASGGTGKTGLMRDGRRDEVRGPNQERAVKASTVPPGEAAACSCGAWRGELGLEPTPALFIEHLMLIFDEVRRVLRPDGLCFVNIGDSYAGSGKGPSGKNGIQNAEQRQGYVGSKSLSGATRSVVPKTWGGLKVKDLMLIPERFAIGMQDRGWYVRSRIAWCKTSAMPESVRDRPTSAWEHVWMFSKHARYYYDAEAVRQPHARLWESNNGGTMAKIDHALAESGRVHQGQNHRGAYPLPNPAGANLRNFWLLGPEPSREQHYAAFPTEIPKRCILAGSRPGDTVLDPFSGSGTTCMVANRLGRNAIGIELNSEYCELSRTRIAADAGSLFGDAVTVEKPEQLSMLEAM